MNKLCALVFLFLLPVSLHAGSRGVSLAFLDATTEKNSKAGLRLAELLEKDMRQLYLDPQMSNVFPWNEQNLKLQVLKAENVGVSFDRLLNTKDEKGIQGLFEGADHPDGLVVLFHDLEHGFARLKLYSQDGKEVLLLRLPLAGKDSPMRDSLMKGRRQAEPPSGRLRHPRPPELGRL